ncbi:MAG: tRNA modification GTPase [Campylobacter sp.]|nr:tRNA modification GTPase [Campylobacter sp.]
MLDTIVAPATAHGVGAISIVRLSGKDALNISLKLLKVQSLEPRYAKFSKIYTLNNELIDEGIIIYFQAPFSFTGEDIVEFQTHGGFSVSNLLVNELVKTLAYVETCIDYAEDDLPSDILSQTNKMLSDNIAKLEEIVNVSEQRKGLIEGFKVTIIGKPNVGKSSLLNALLRKDRAIISDEAGTTRDTIEESLLVGTHLVCIVDTAGIREGTSNIENIGIEHSMRVANEADIIIAVFDNSREFTLEDNKILTICEDALNAGKKVIFALNKSDLSSKFSANFKSSPIKISAKSSLCPLIETLKDYLDSMNYEGIMLITTRQINATKNSLNALKRAFIQLDDGALELFAYELNLAISEISTISRPFQRSEILDEMFSSFCLGK